MPALELVVRPDRGLYGGGDLRRGVVGLEPARQVNGEVTRERGVEVLDAGGEPGQAASVNAAEVRLGCKSRWREPLFGVALGNVGWTAAWPLLRCREPTTAITCWGDGHQRRISVTAVLAAIR